MKNILYIHHTSCIGGASYCLLNILKALDRTIYNPIVMLKNDGPLVQELKILNISVMFFPQMVVLPYNKPMYKLSTISAYLSIKKAVALFELFLRSMPQIDAVYFNTIVMSPYLRIAKKCGKKTVIHIREHWPLDEHKKQLQKIQNFIRSFADEVIAINRYSASMIVGKQVTIVYDWIDFTDRYHPYSYNDIFGEDCSRLKVFLYTGGVQKIKGAFEVISTFVECQKDSMNRLLLVGVDPSIKIDSLRQKIKIYLAQLGVKSFEIKVKKLINSDSRIKCIPATYALRDIMSKAYCNLSFFTIPHANLALAENLILGTPSIAARTDEAVEYSDGGRLALLYEFGSIEDYRQKILKLDNVYDSLHEEIQQQKKQIEEQFDKAKNVQRLNAVLIRLLS